MLECGSVESFIKTPLKMTTATSVKLRPNMISRKGLATTVGYNTFERLQHELEGISSRKQRNGLASTISQTHDFPIIKPTRSGGSAVQQSWSPVVSNKVRSFSYHHPSQYTKSCDCYRRERISRSSSGRQPTVLETIKIRDYCTAN